MANKPYIDLNEYANQKGIKVYSCEDTKDRTLLEILEKEKLYLGLENLNIQLLTPINEESREAFLGLPATCSGKTDTGYSVTLPEGRYGAIENIRHELVHIYLGHLDKLPKLPILKQIYKSWTEFTCNFYVAFGYPPMLSSKV